MRKFFAVALALCLITAMTIPAFATEVDSNSVALEDIIAQIRSENPTATITVNNGTISVFVPMSTERYSRVSRPDAYSVMATETTYTAREGGRFA